MRPKGERLSRIPLTGIILMLAVCLAGNSRGEEGALPSLLLGGYFEKPPIRRYLPGSKRTLIYPAMIGRHGEITPVTGFSLRNDDDAWDSLVRDFRERASLLMATLDPVLVRDRHGVIQMAVITGEDPMTASCILSPGFLPRFSAVFGPELIVAVPTRNKIYVFPKLANRLSEVGTTIRDDYLGSPSPVSCELFEMTKSGLRTVGTADPGNE